MILHSMFLHNSVLTLPFCVFVAAILDHAHVCILNNLFQWFGSRQVIINMGKYNAEDLYKP